MQFKDQVNTGWPRCWLLPGSLLTAQFYEHIIWYFPYGFFGILQWKLYIMNWYLWWLKCILKTMLLLIVWEHITMKTSFDKILSYITNSNWIYQEHKPCKTFSFYLSFEWQMSNFIIHHAMIESLWLGYCMHTHQLPTILFGLQTMLIHIWETPLKSAVCSVKCTVWPLSGALAVNAVHTTHNMRTVCQSMCWTSHHHGWSDGYFSLKY